MNIILLLLEWKAISLYITLCNNAFMLPIYAALLVKARYLFVYLYCCVSGVCVLKHILFNYYIIPFIIFVYVWLPCMYEIVIKLVHKLELCTYMCRCDVSAG